MYVAMYVCICMTQIEVIEALVDSRQGRLSAQILGEFMSATTRGRRPILTTDEARAQVTLLAMPCLCWR